MEYLIIAKNITTGWHHAHSSKEVQPTEGHSSFGKSIASTKVCGRLAAEDSANTCIQNMSMATLRENASETPVAVPHVPVHGDLDMIKESKNEAIVVSRSSVTVPEFLNLEPSLAMDWLEISWDELHMKERIGAGTIFILYWSF